MKEKELEQQFKKAITDKSVAANLQCGCNSSRFLETVARLGGVGAVKALIRKGFASENFDTLRAAGKLTLSVEATVTESKYAALFTDEEVDFCLALLCESGFYHTS